MATEVLVLMLIFGVVGGVIAGSKGRNSFGWLVICCLTGIIGIIIVVALPSVASSADKLAKQKGALPASPVEENRLIDTSKWEALKEVDPEIKAASDKILALQNGRQLELKLAEKYLILSDKQYLSALVELIEKDASASETGPIEGKVGLSEFKRSPDGKYVITKGAFIGHEYNTYQDMRKSFGYKD